MLRYIEVVIELLLLTQSHQTTLRKETKKVKFQEKEQISQQQTIEIEQMKQIATVKFNYSSSQAMEFPPLLRASRDHSTLQP